MKLVGKINIEVWDGDPNDPNSKLKQEVEEYNDVHPDMDNAWDSAFYHRAWIDENWSNGREYTNPNTGNWGRFADEPTQFSIRLGFHNDKEKLSKNLAAGKTNTNLKKLGDYAGIDKAGYLYFFRYGLTTSAGIRPAAERLKLSDIARKDVDSLGALWYAHIALPIAEGSEFEYFNKHTFSKQYDPTGENFTIKNIGLYGCYVEDDYTNGDYPSRYITSNIKDSSIGITFHEFNTPIEVTSTDYIKVNYEVTVITTLQLDAPKRSTILTKDGKEIGAYRFPVLLGFNAMKESDSQTHFRCWFDDSHPIVHRPLNNDYNNKKLLHLCGISAVYSEYSLYLVTNWDSKDIYLGNLGIKDNPEFIESVNEGKHAEELWGHLASKIFSKEAPKESTELHPIIGYYDRYAGIGNNGSNSSNRLTNTYMGNVSLRNKLKNGESLQHNAVLNLPAKDDSNINKSYRGLVELPFSYFSSNNNSGNIAYLTVFEEPLEKTKFDELKIVKDITFFSNKWENPFNKDLSKSEEQE